MGTPWGFSNRSLVVCQYHKEGEKDTDDEGSYWFVSSERGCEHYVKKLQKNGTIDSDDVIALNLINMQYISPAKDPKTGEKIKGTWLKEVSMWSPVGSIPSFAISILASRSAASCEKMIVHLREERDGKLKN